MNYAYHNHQMWQPESLQRIEFRPLWSLRIINVQRQCLTHYVSTTPYDEQHVEDEQTTVLVPSDRKITIRFVGSLNPIPTTYD